jgi:MATE family multidrug resistance protein
MTADVLGRHHGRDAYKAVALDDEADLVAGRHDQHPSDGRADTATGAEESPVRVVFGMGPELEEQQDNEPLLAGPEVAAEAKRCVGEHLRVERSAAPNGAALARHNPSRRRPLPPPPPNTHPSPPPAPNPNNQQNNRLWRLGGPLLVQNVLSFLLSVTPLAFVGHLNDAVALSGVVLASSFFNISGFAVICGLASGSETLCGQAFGARQYRVLGGVALRALAVCFAASLPVLLLWTQYVQPLLLALGQQPAVAAVAAKYLHQARPALVFACVSEVCKRYLLSQRVVVPGVVVMAVTMLLAPLWCWLLIFRLEMGIDGAGPAFVISSATGAVLLLAYVAQRDWRRRHDPDATFCFSSAREAFRAAFSGWGVYLSLAVPALFHMASEWWWYEGIILIAGGGKDGQVEGGAAGLIFQCSALVFMSAMAIGSSTTTRVANELGAGRAKPARRAAAVAMAMTLLLQSSLVVAMVLGREALLAAFTNSLAIKRAALAAWFPLAASIVSDAANCILSAVMRGSGRQALGAWINVLGYWGAGLPLCFWLGRKYALFGLWGAVALTSTGVAATQLFFVLRFDWRAEVRRARELSASQARAAEGGEAAVAGEEVVTAPGGYLRVVREDVEDAEDGGARSGRDQLQQAKPIKGAGSRELPLTLHAPASRAASAAWTELSGGGSFSRAG